MTIYDDFTLMLKVDGDLAANVRLHLSDAPIGRVRVPHQHAGFENRNEVSHKVPFMKGPGR